MRGERTGWLAPIGSIPEFGDATGRRFRPDPDQQHEKQPERSRYPAISRDDNSPGLQIGLAPRPIPRVIRRTAGNPTGVALRNIDRPVLLDERRHAIAHHAVGVDGEQRHASAHRRYIHLGVFFADAEISVCRRLLLLSPGTMLMRLGGIPVSINSQRARCAAA